MPSIDFPLTLIQVASATLHPSRILPKKKQKQRSKQASTKLESLDVHKKLVNLHPKITLNTLTDFHKTILIFSLRRCQFSSVTGTCSRTSGPKYEDSLTDPGPHGCPLSLKSTCTRSPGSMAISLN